MYATWRIDLLSQLIVELAKHDLQYHTNILAPSTSSSNEGKGTIVRTLLLDWHLIKCTQDV